MNIVRNLATLIYPMHAPSFFSQQWQKECVCLHGPPQRFREISLNLNDYSESDGGLARAVTMRASADVQAWYASGDAGGFKIPAEHAPIFSALRMTLYFEDLPLLRPFGDIIASDLNVPKSAMAVSAFLSRAGGTTRMHFDANENFTLQLRGRKKWRTARNKSVSRPTQNANAGEEMHPELRPQARRAFPREMPREAREFILEPGSVLYVPRGHWHEVEALEDSLSLNISYQVVTLADLLRPTARARAIKTHAFRRSAFGGSARQRQATLRIARALLNDFRPALAQREIARILATIAKGDTA